MSDIESVWPIRFDAQKVGFNQNLEGIALRLVVHPNADCVPILAAIPMKCRLKISIEPDDGEPGSAQAERKVGLQAPALPPVGQRQQSLTLSQKAGMLADDLQFQVWASDQIAEIWQPDNPHNCGLGDLAPKSAKEFIYRRCGISSLKELNTDEGARDLYWRMLGQYKQEMKA